MSALLNNMALLSEMPNYPPHDVPHSAEDCSFSSFPPGTLPYSGKSGSSTSVQLDVHPSALPENIELKWCLCWALIFGSMTSSDKVVFGVIPVGPDMHHVPRQNESSINARLPIAVHMKLSDHASIFQYQKHLSNQLTGQKYLQTDNHDPSGNVMCSFNSVVAVRSSSLAESQTELDICHLPLFVELAIGDNTAEVVARFDSAIIDHWLVNALLRRLAHVMPQLTDNDKLLSEIDLMPQYEWQKIWGWNKVVPAPVERFVHDMITERVMMHPNRIAVSAWDGELTYHDLDQLADELSGIICRLGVRHGDLIPVCFEKSLWAFVSILAVLKAGCAFVPLDPSLPLKRLHMITQQIQPLLMLSSVTAETLCSHLVSRVVVVRSEIFADVVDKGPHTTRVMERPSSESPMYVIFTSGSTGVPKGVVITHTSFASAISYQKDALRYSATTRFYDFPSIGFDGSIHTFQVLFSGGCLCIPADLDRKENLAASITALGANTIFLTPSVARLLNPAQTSTLGMVVLGGEAVQEIDVKRWWGRARVANGYGPSECTPFSVLNTEPKTPSEAARIGFGAGQVTWIVDPFDHDKLMPLGCTGELLLEGPMNGNYYLGDPTKTAASFIDPPSWLRGLAFPDTLTPRSEFLYKTGDLVHYNDNGSITFVGRKDTQVKIHGLRVELGEVEHHLMRQIPHAKQVVAEVVERKGKAYSTAAMLVVAFIQVKDSAPHAPLAPPLTLSDLTPVEARELAPLAALLPRHMVPTMAFYVPRISMTSTDKTDRRTLRKLAGAFQSAKIQQLQDLEQQHGCVGRGARWLQDVWGHILGVNMDAIGADTNFFHMGGSSVLAMEIVAVARAKGFALSLADVFRHPSLLDLARQARPLGEDSQVGFIAPFSLLPAQVARGDSFREDLGVQYDLDPATIEDVYPATPLQEGLITLSLREPKDYFMQRVLELSPEISIPEFRHAWDEVAQIITPLRTRMVQHRDLGGFLQLVSGEPITWVEEIGLEEYLARGRSVPISIGDRLSRFALVRNAPCDKPRWFVLSLHHAAYDGWMLPLLFQIVSQTYQGRSSHPRHPFKAFIRYLANKDSAVVEKYWIEALEGCESTPFPLTPQALTDKGSTKANEKVRHALPLEMRGRSSHITDSTHARAAWAIVAGGMTNSRHVSFGVTVSGRGAQVEGITEMIGPTMATVPLFVQLDNRQNIVDFLESIQQQAIDMIPFEQAGLQNISRFSPSCYRACAFQTLLLVQPAQRESPHDATGKWQEGDDEQFSTYGLVIEVELSTNVATASFNPDSLERQTVQKLLERFGLILSRLVRGELDTSPLADLKSAMGPDLDLIWKWNRHLPEPVEQCVHHVIRERALSDPNRTALDAWDGKLSYQQLDEYASKVAKQIMSFGNQQKGLIPICFEKSIWAIVSVLGVLKSGKGFVMLEPSLPEQRLRTMCDQIGSDIVLSSHANMALSSRICRDAMAVGPESVHWTTHHRYSAAEPPRSFPEMVMYGVFTSGSTGTPKAVLISHANFRSSLEYQLPSLEFNRDSRVLDFASYSFDAAVHNIMATLATGGCLCIPAEQDRRERLKELFTTFSPSIANLTPTVARLIDPSTVPSLRTLILLGEPVTSEDARRWWSRLNLINTYGPAECTPISTINTAASNAHEATRIGKGVGVVTWVVDPDDHECLLPPGCTGELVLEGPLVGLGYLGDAGKTAASFVEYPAWLSRGRSGHPDRRRRLYKTGDLVRYNHDGSLTYVCRKDTQVKVRGQRVELGDIEHHVETCIEDAVRVVAEMCTAGGQENPEPTLCAFVQLKLVVETVVSKTTGSTAGIYPIPPKVRKKMAAYLPSHMIPQLFFWLSQLPQTATGKTDRRQLRELGSSLLAEYQSQRHPPPQCEQTGERSEPIRSTEQPAYCLAQKIFSMLPRWAHCSRPEEESPTAFDDISLHSSGLDSVNFMTLLHFISQTFGDKVSMRTLMDTSTTIRGLANTISSLREDSVPTAADSPRYPRTTNTSPTDLVKEIDRHHSTVAKTPQWLNGSPVEKVEMPSAAAGPHSTKQLVVFLTGATGFIGTQILRQLLQHCQVGRVISLVRGETQVAARERTIAAAIKAQWWMASYGDKLDVWPGDLSLPHLGLDISRWRALRGDKEVDLIIHNGAKVHWTMSYAALEASNVNSTVELARLAVHTPRMRLVYVSGGQAWDARLQTENDMAAELSTSGAVGYSQSKFVAEAVVRRAALGAAEGRIGVVSPRLVVGTPGEGIANADDYFWRLVAACLRIGAYKEDDVEAWLPVSDVEFVASTIVSAALAEAKVPVETLISDGIHWGRFWEILHEAGYQLQGMEADSWSASISRDIDMAKEAHPLWPLAHQFRQEGTRDIAMHDAAQQTSPRLEIAMRKCVDTLAKAGVITPANNKPSGTMGPREASISSLLFSRSGVIFDNQRLGLNFTSLIVASMPKRRA